MIAAWRDEAHRPGLTNQELDTALQLPVILGCTVDGLPYIMLLTDQQPKVKVRLEAIDVRVGRREKAWVSEQWTLMFILQDWSLIHAFAEICLAFADRIAVATSREDALRQVYATVDQWQRLLKASRNTDMMKVLRGAFGELVTALEIMRHTGKPIEEVCRAWTGPYETPQDFTFSNDETAWEVKATRKAAKQIAISSPEQLDTAGKTISLAVVEIEEPESNEQGFTLPRLVDRLRSFADNPSEVTEYVDGGLAQLRLNLYSGLCSQTAFHVGRISVYTVAGDFPRVTTELIPPGVSKLTYHIDRSALTPYLQYERTPNITEE